jgi:hypothetical protein
MVVRSKEPFKQTEKTASPNVSAAEQSWVYWLSSDFTIQKSTTPLRRQDTPPFSQKTFSHIGQSYLSVVSGAAAQQWVAARLQKVFYCGQPLRVDYRCDDDQWKRWCTMSLELQSDGLLQVSHWVLDTQPMPLISNRLPSATKTSVARCSICCRYQVDYSWLELDDAQVLLGDMAAQPCHYVVCDACK